MSFSIRIPLTIAATCNTARKSIRGLLALAIVFSVTNPSFGQNQNSGQSTRDEKKTWYKVEIILFRQGGNPLESLEQWDSNPKMSYPLNWASLVSPESLASEPAQDVDTSTDTRTSPSTSSTLPPRSILMLPKESFALKSEAQKLQRSSKYRILFHGAWQQGFTDGKEPPAIIINAGDVFDSHAELEGTIQLKLQRYLHITTDLWLTQFTTNFGQERSRWPELPWPPNKTRTDIPGASDEKNFGGSTSWNQLPATTRYDSLLSKPYIIENIAKINETRRMRSKELHYIDHPLLGILIQFTPSETPSPL